MCYKIIIFCLLNCSLVSFAAQEIEQSYLEAILQTSPEGLPTLLIKKLVEDADTFEQATMSIKSLFLTSSKTDAVFDIMRNPYVIDYIIAVLMSKFPMSLVHIINTLGYQVVEFWVEKLTHLRSQFATEGYENIIYDKTLLPYVTYTLLSMKKKLSFIHYLLDNNIDFHLDMIDDFGKTPLMYAVINGDINLVKRLINRGAQVNRYDNDSKNAWLYAKIFNYQDIAVLLESFGGTTEQDAENWTIFLENLAQNLFPQDEQQEENFVVQALNDNINIIDILANKFSEQEQLIFVRNAAFNSEIAFLILAKQAGIEINNRYVDSSNITTLMYAVYGGDLEVVKFLIYNGADARAADDQGNTVLIHAIDQQHYDIVEFLLTLNIDVNALTNNGQSALAIVAFIGNIDLANLLLIHGANINSIDQNGFTPLMTTTLQGHYDLAQFLVDKGGDFNTDLIDPANLNAQDKSLLRYYAIHSGNALLLDKILRDWQGETTEESLTRAQRIIERHQSGSLQRRHNQ